MNTLYAVPDHATADKIKKTRKALGMTQKQFAGFLNVSVPTIERWETTDKPVHGPIALLTDILYRNPDLAESRKIPDKVYPVRLWYMYKDEVCTIIDVDMLNQRIKIKNFQRNILFRAFGSKTDPSWEDYEAFLESRCFPRERDKMKLILKELNLPFYDPLMIVEKTQGRMAEDDFWIKVE